MATTKNSHTSRNSRWAARYFRSDQVATTNEPSRKASPICCQYDSDRARFSTSLNHGGSDMTGAGASRPVRFHLLDVVAERRDAAV